MECRIQKNWIAVKNSPFLAKKVCQKNIINRYIELTLLQKTSLFSRSLLNLVMYVVYLKVNIFGSCLYNDP